MGLRLSEISQCGVCHCTVNICHYTYGTYRDHCFNGKLWCLFGVLSLYPPWILLHLATLQLTYPKTQPLLR